MTHHLPLFASFCALELPRDVPDVAVEQFLIRQKKKKKKKIGVFQVSALKNLDMVGRHNILFCQNILYKLHFSIHFFPHFSAI